MTKITDLYHPAWQLYDSSKIQCAMDCLRKYFFSYILGWNSDVPNQNLVFGQALHEAMQYIMLSSMTEDTIELAYERFIDYYRTYFPPETDELYTPKTPDNAFYGLATYISHYRNQDNFKTLYTEVGGKVSTGKHDIIYKLDHIGQDEQNRIFGFEHKTTKWGIKKIWMDEWLLSIQIGTYSYALRCLYPDASAPTIIVNGISFSKKKVDYERQPIKKTPNQLQVWLFTVNYWIDTIKDELDRLLNTENIETDQVMTCFPMNPRACTNYFRLCPYHDFCLAWPQPLKRAFDGPPEGFKVKHWDPLEELPIKFRVDLGGRDS